MRTRRHHAFTRTLIAACAAALCGFAGGSASAAPGNMLQNSSLEQWTGSTPTCWLLGGYGTNDYGWNHLTGNDAYNGDGAIELDISNLESGDRKLLTAFNGNCSPAVSAGHQYTVDVWYKSDSRPVFFAFRPNPSGGGWSFWAQSPPLPPAADWTHAEWTTPAIPSGTSLLSVGLGLRVTGSLEMDDFSMVDTAGSSASDTTSPSTAISCNGAPCAGYYNGPVTIALDATDDSGGSGVAEIRYTTDGTTPTATSGRLYSGPFSVGSNTTIKYLAVDNAGNVSPVATQTIASAPSAPSAPSGLVVSGQSSDGFRVSWSASSDDVGVSGYGVYLNGSRVGSTGAAELSYRFAGLACGSSFTFGVDAVDGAGNRSGMATVSVSTLACGGASDQTLPTVSLTAPATGATISGTTTFAANASDNVGVKQVDFLVDGTLVGSDPTGSPYTFSWDSSTVAGGLHSVAARAIDLAGNTRTTAAVNVTVSNVVIPPPPLGGQRFDTTAPAGTTGLPRSLSYCMASIVRDSYNPNGNSSFNVPRDDLGTGWGDSLFSWWSSFPKWITRRGQIDDHYTFADGSKPTTTEIFSIGACRWGVREDLLRAVSVQESDWHEHGGSFMAWGDRCSGHSSGDDGFGSYGIMQVKNLSCSGEGDWGGFPRSWYSAPFNVDLYGAAFRSCLEGALWFSIPAGDSADRRERGCVGAWFSGSYAPDSSYANSVYGHLANRDWLRY